MYPNHRYFERHPEEAEKLKENTSGEYEFCPTQSVGQHLLIDAVCNETGLDAALAESFPGFSQEIEACMKYYLSARDTDMSGFSCYGTSERTTSLIWESFSTRGLHMKRSGNSFPPG